MRLLVAEHSRDLASVIVEALGGRGMAIDVAHDGHEAIKKLDIHAYDIVVLDRELSGPNTDTICGMIAHASRPIMVLILSRGTPEERVHGLRLGADDYLAKPFHVPELVLRIAALARRQPAARTRVFRAAGIELDPQHHTAIRGGQQLNLSAKEFGVLEALMRADHTVLSVEDLYEQVWNEHTDPFTNTVKVTIDRLRRKLGDPLAIETIPRVGYRLTTASRPSSRPSTNSEAPPTPHPTRG